MKGYQSTALMSVCLELPYVQLYLLMERPLGELGSNDSIECSLIVLVVKNVH